jgi:hypothetical protein
MQLGLTQDRIARWVLGAVGVLIFLLGLFLAARGDGEFANAGVFMALFAVGLVFWQIKRSFDIYDADPERPRNPMFASTVPPVPSTPPKLPTDHDPDAHAPAHRFEGGAAKPARTQPEPTLDEHSANLFKGIVFAALALVCLFVGASGEGWSYYGGLAAAFVFVALIVRAAVGAVSLTPPAGIGRWIVGGFVGLGAIVALLIAAGSGGGPGYYIGLIVTFGAVGYLFFLIKTSFDEADSH